MNRLSLKKIPPVHELLEDTDIKSYLTDLDRDLITHVIRKKQETLRGHLLSEQQNKASNLKSASKSDLYRKLKQSVLAELRVQLQSSYRRVINCTGTVLHTNLGRAVIAQEVMNRVANTVSSYSNLEFDLETGERGSRYSHVEELITTLTGAESALVVNNNAAAVLLTLKALAEDREVIISRGELVEIGGSFRIPEVMKQSGAILNEVGTTNKTHLKDFEGAVHEETGLILKVHTSNYHIVGFTDSVSRRDLADLAQRHGLPFVEDLGSGLLVDLKDYGLEGEPTIKEVLDAGVDLVTFSGDKLLGGPQAGIVAGKKSLVDRLKKNQLTRAMRIDKFCLKALEETLRIYLNPSNAVQKIPTLRNLTVSLDELKDRGEPFCEDLSRILYDCGLKVDLIQEQSRVGGGAMPTQQLMTWAVVVSGDHQRIMKLAKALRQSEPAIITRIQNEQLLFDMRTVDGDETKEILGVIDRLISRKAF